MAILSFPLSPTVGDTYSANGMSWIWDGETWNSIKSIDHGGLTGLGDDDHTQYHTDARGDARYVQLTTNFGGDVTGTYDNIQVTNDSHTHDTRYYTETESDARFAPISHTHSYLPLSGGTLTGGLTGTTATFSGNLTVDTNTLFVDSTNNRVGVGTITPSTNLDVVGNTTVSGDITTSAGNIIMNDVSISRASASEIRLTVTNSNDSSSDVLRFVADAADEFRIVCGPRDFEIRNVSDPGEGEYIKLVGVSGSEQVEIGIDGNTIATVTSTGVDVAGNITYVQPIVEKTASYTAAASDAGSMIRMNSSSATTITVDSSTNLPVGQRIDILRSGSGSVTVVGSGVTVYSTPANTLRAQNSAATLVRTNASFYHLIGDLG